ncbi:enoyl-CoA hydratase/isomerase family protein [Bacillaceae bacterium Marseille-Q3522]|nr:enoyl-CoA hydratase/isomerase family protein [Bacillaceae bacterium Marseille-Q3522]
MTEYNTILLEKAEKLAVLTINRPKALNALSTEVLIELNGALDDIASDQTIQAVVITGHGEKSFVAGADIGEMAAKNVLEGKAFSTFGNAVFSKLEHLRQPVIAAVNGYALGGGCELALACDLRIAATNAIFGQPEAGLGIIPGFGGTQRLSRLVGPARAKELIYTGSTINAEKAYEIGLVNYVTEKGKVVDEAKQLAKKIIKNAPLAVEYSKNAINQGLNLDLHRALTFEAEVFASLFATEDQKEGMNAFMGKRKAVFTRK